MVRIQKKSLFCPPQSPHPLCRKIPLLGGGQINKNTWKRFRSHQKHQPTKKLPWKKNHLLKFETNPLSPKKMVAIYFSYTKKKTLPFLVGVEPNPTIIIQQSVFFMAKVPAPSSRSDKGRFMKVKQKPAAPWRWVRQNCWPFPTKGWYPPSGRIFNISHYPTGSRKIIDSKWAETNPKKSSDRFPTIHRRVIFNWENWWFGARWFGAL